MKQDLKEIFQAKNERNLLSKFRTKLSVWTILFHTKIKDYFQHKHLNRIATQKLKDIFKTTIERKIFYTNIFKEFKHKY